MRIVKEAYLVMAGAGTVGDRDYFIVMAEGESHASNIANEIASENYMDSLLLEQDQNEAMGSCGCESCEDGDMCDDAQEHADELMQDWLMFDVIGLYDEVEHAHYYAEDMR